MSVVRLVLGVMASSRRASVQKVLGNATGSDRCTEKSRELKERHTHSLWHLAEVEARAFGTIQCNPGISRFPAQVAALLSLVFYERRQHPSGQAVCMLGLRRWRLCGAVAGLVVLISGLGALSPYACVTVVVGIIVSLLPRAVRTGRAFAAQADLRAFLPARPYVYVHSLASTWPGAGGELLRDLAQEADHRGWSLVLDASNEKLACYYGTFGFVARGQAVRMPDGGSRIRMWRAVPALEQPSADRGRGLGVKQ